MGLNPFVTSIISTQPVGVPRASFGVPALLSYNATAFGADRTRFYASVDEVAADFPSLTGPEYLWATAVFSQADPVPERIAILRGSSAPTMLYTGSVYALTPGETYTCKVRGDGVTTTDIEIPLPLTDVTVSAVANASETFTAVAHGMATGDGPYRLTNSGGGLPAGTAVDTNYWIIKLTADTFRLASSYANAIALTPVAITTDGTGTHTVRRTVNDVLVALLVDRLNSVVGKNYTAAQVTGSGDTDTFTVTGSATGEWFSIEILPSQFVLALTHTDPGVAADLTAIAAAGNGDGWYELHTAYNSTAYLTAAAAWIEAASPPRTYQADTCNTLSWTDAGTTGNDIANVLHGLGYTRTQVNGHNRPAEFIGGAVAGRSLGLDPGSIARAHKALVGVTPMTLTSTQVSNLIGTAAAPGKCANGYFYVGGVGNFAPGRMASGEWWDVIRNDDSVNSDIEADLFDMVRQNQLVPYSDEGVALAEGVLRARLKQAKAAGIYQEPIRVTAVKAADVSTTDRSRRKYTGLSWSAVRVGAMVFLTATGTVTT